MSLQNNILLYMGIATITLLGATIGFEMWYDMPYMYSDDPYNPGSYGGLVITNSVKTLGDSLVLPSDTPHNMTMKYMRWTMKNIEFEQPPPRHANPDVIIDSGIGLCGDYAIVVTSLLATQHVPSRIIGMYNYTNGAHVVIEVYYNNSWHMYGPTLCSYWEKDGRVLSFEELRNGGARTANVHYENHRICPDQYTNPEIYELSEPAGVIGPEYPMWWPLVIDREFVVPEIGNYAAGSRHIGATYTNNNQNWTITNLTPGNNYSFVIYPKEIFGTDVFELVINETGNYHITTTEPIYINFTAHNTTENLHIGHNHTGREHIVMNVLRYEVKDAGS